MRYRVKDYTVQPVEGGVWLYFTAPEGVTEVVLVIKGDANLDGEFTNYDVTIAKAASLGRDVPHQGG